MVPGRSRKAVNIMFRSTTWPFTFSGMISTVSPRRNGRNTAIRRLAVTLLIIGGGFLATWTMISNVTANLLIAVLRPFRLGDTVEIIPENVKGQVVDRNMMFTALRERPGTTLHVPNNLFFQKLFRVTEQDAQNSFEFTGE